MWMLSQNALVSVGCVQALLKLSSGKRGVWTRSLDIRKERITVQPMALFWNILMAHCNVLGLSNCPSPIREGIKLEFYYLFHETLR